MEKRILVGSIIAVVILVLVSFKGVVGYQTNYSPKPEFEIEYRTFYIGELWFDIKNVGDIDAINVNWSIKIDFYIIMIDPPPIPLPYWNGTIPILSVNESERISSDGFIVGLGFHKIIITLNATNSEELIKIPRGVFFGPIIWMPKWLWPIRCELE